MKSPRTRRSKKASPADSSGERDRALVAREEAVARRERVLRLEEAAFRASQPPMQSRAEIERLMDRMREANERLIVAAVQAQNLSDEAHLEATQATAELDHLMSRLRGANEQLATMAEEASEREEQYRRLSSRLLTLQDEERRRLALDLHDRIGQRLAALAMNLDVIEQTAKALDARSRQVLAESRSLADQCAREVRTFAYLLHPPLLDEVGLLSAVRWYTEGFAKRSGIRVAMDVGEIGRMPAPVETALFRVVQEALTNVHRHASTTLASIRLTATPDAVTLDIHDEGQGLRDPVTHQPGTLRENLGVGIQGMRERVRQLGGTFAVEFRDTGTTVRVRVPIDRGTP